MADVVDVVDVEDVADVAVVVDVERPAQAVGTVVVRTTVRSNAATDYTRRDEAQ